MGLWVEEKRHGSGVVVTQHGVYYEGTFRDNKMSVSLNMRGTGGGVPCDGGWNTDAHGEAAAKLPSRSFPPAGFWPADF